MVRVAVIGAGPSGLTSIKACKESNIDVICYEWSESIGGIWRYKEKPVEGMGSVDKTTVINTSKEYLAYSDFPFPKDYANFMRHTYVLKYLNMYAEKFELLDCIKFNHKVIKIAPTDDYESTGRWKITLRVEKQLSLVEDVVDAVMVCAGHHGYPLKARFPGDEKFRGSIIHHHSYRNTGCYEGKRVLVVGLGNTAGDVAVEICTLTEKTYISSRSGSWILKRVDKYGVPYDVNFLNRISDAMMRLLPFNWACSLIEHQLTNWFDHEKYQLKPKHRVLQQQITLNDSLPEKILTGQIVMKGNVQRFEENGVVFEGEQEVTEIDDVILTTGYETKFPFLSNEVLPIEDNKVYLYKLVFPPHLKNSTFGMIGLFDGLGGTFPYLEMQARWFVEVLKKRVCLPSESEMRKDISDNIKRLRNRYYESPRHNVLAEYISYLDDISSLIGVKPNFSRMFFKDPKLWLALMTGPCTSFQYRLNGIHSWPLARETILNTDKRIWAPLQTRFKKTGNESSKIWKMLAIAFVVLAVCLFFKL